MHFNKRLCDTEVHFVSQNYLFIVVGFGDINKEVVRLEVETPAEMVQSSGK